MISTPSTSHVSFATIYEPAEDSFLLLDILSSPAETEYLSARFHSASAANESSARSTRHAPLVVEVGTGSGVVLAFLTANAKQIFGHANLFSLGVDVNLAACRASSLTVEKAVEETSQNSRVDHAPHPDTPADPSTSAAQLLDTVAADLGSVLRPGIVDLLVFNPPYVPTAEMPLIPSAHGASEMSGFEEESHLLSLSYAGGADGMETTNRLLAQLPCLLSDRGVAYILLCASNKPESVKGHVRAWGRGWIVETVGYSGVKAGWEKLQILRISRAGSISSNS
ncbi:MAG: hypothetical protein M1825_001735 [Sarcosagium campestre]|nr:MAG: hypothetical protein M1825_001735 [Sarcosagium campestre]